MKATEAKLLDFLKKSPQFVIPIYQRTYSWTEKECRQLWDDILRTGKDDTIAVHFVGSIVYIEKADSTVTTWEPLLVIDGQQRLTTVTLLIAALAKTIGDDEPLDGFSAEMLRGYYLQNPLERGERKFKLILSQNDKASLIAIINNQAQPDAFSLKIKQNFELFCNLIEESKNELPTLCKGLAKLMMVDIKLKRGEDNPQLIFESMNSTGKKLSQADLIRNYILMGLEQDQQTQLYEDYWRPMEVAFGQEAYDTHFDAFMRDYLTHKTHDIPRKDQVYEAFRLYAGSATVASGGVEALVKNIRDFARYFCAMALGAENDSVLKVAFHDLRELNVGVAYPFLLELYHDYATNLLSKEDFHKAIRLIEAYVFRRAVCNIPTNSMNKTFESFGKALKKDRYLESLTAHFLLLPSYRRYPSDDEFEREIKIRDLYNFSRRSYWLRRFETFGRKEVASVDEYTVEHILPQNEKLSSAWQSVLGEDWKRVQKEYLHTLGNLTLTGYNSEYSDRSFEDKRDMVGGFKESPLIVNKGLGEVLVWNQEAIITRANMLAKRAVQVWPSATLGDDILAAYQPNNGAPSTFTLVDHPNLKIPVVRELFDALRKEILALDPCVNEEFLKLYVAYKAETNFVDVVPQTKRLRLSLNMRFAEINDPKGMCRDITDIGRWGNGDVDVMLSTLDEVPYVVGLIRQSLEKQLGDEV